MMLNTLRSPIGCAGLPSQQSHPCLFILITSLIITLFSIPAYCAVIDAGQTVTVPFINGEQNPDDPTSPNSWMVDNFGGNLNVNGTLNVLHVNNVSGAVTAYSTIAGQAAGSEGVVNISGPGSQLINQSFMTVGLVGKGYLTISDGGFVSNQSSGQVGMGIDSVGIAHITGINSLWNSNQELLIGGAGDGTVAISGGAKVKVTSVVLARDLNSSGILVMGAEEGAAPVAAGILEATRITAGAGSATLLLNHSSSNYVFDSTLNRGLDNAQGSGTGLVGNILIDALAGTTLFNSDHGDYTGTLQVSENARVSVNGDMSGGAVSVLEGGVLQGTGRVGNTVNAGTISPGNSIGTFTIDGDYHGNGGTLLMESVLGGDDSPSDRLHITGSASGDTQVKVVNLDGEGAFTHNGIPLIYAGQLSDHGAFKLNGDYVTSEGEQAVIGGAYAYALRSVQFGDGRWWYLTSDLADPEVPVAPIPEVPTPETPEPGTVTPGVPVFPIIPETPDEKHPQRYHPGAALYEQYPQVLAELNRVPTLQQRIGDRYWVDESSQPVEGSPGGWARVEGSHNVSDPAASTTGAQREVNLWKIQTGVDVPMHETQQGLLTGGVNFSYGKANADINSYSGSGDINTTGYGPGLTLTWYGNSGFYVDSQIQMMFFESDLNSATIGQTLKSANKGKGYAGSVETGWRLDAGNGYAVTPQAQLVWSRTSFDSFEDAFGSKVSLDDGNSLLARLGVSGDHRSEWKAKDGTQTRSYLHANLDVYQEMADGSSVDVADVKFRSRDARTQVALAVGGTLDLHDGRYAVYGNVGVQASPHNPSDNYGAGGNVGVRVSW